ncbi:hypothetical protein EMN47_12835 [Prolixibacteraceae bacterium JC049]|nr:hypothetical protein [Prolixibacteraceae bacterium JC049]
MNSLKSILLLATTLIFVACEYEPEGSNYIELTPPENSIPIQISLNDINPSDTIYLYKSADFSVKVKSIKDLKLATISIDGELIRTMRKDSVSFQVYLDQLGEGVHKVTVNATFATNTGSLADLMGLEGYTGELTWNIRVINNPEEHFNIGYRSKEDGFLEIFWNSPLPQSLIEKYSIYSGLTQNSEISIYDPNQKSFTDYGYVCGYVYYDVKVYLKDGNTFQKGISFCTAGPNIYFEDQGTDNLRIYWDKPFANGRFDLLCNEKIIVSEITDTTVTIPQLFGRNRKFRLDVRPQKTGYDNFHNRFSAYGRFTQGTLLDLPNCPLYAYNKTDDIIYTSRYSDLLALDANSLQKKNEITIKGNPWGILYGGKIATAPHDSRIAAMTGEETWIFADSRFVDPIKISPLRGNVNTRLAALTSNDRFFVVEQDSTKCKVFNSLTGDKIFEIPFTYKTKYTFPNFTTVSEDGQYFCASSTKGIEVFGINGTTKELLYTDTREYEGAMFVPDQPDQLLLSVNSNIELRKIPDFTLIQSLDISRNKTVLCNIDPVSKNILYYQNDSLKVCPIDNLSKTIFKIRCDERSCKLYKNKIFTHEVGAITFDITPHIKD